MAQEEYFDVLQNYFRKVAAFSYHTNDTPCPVDVFDEAKTRPALKRKRDSQKSSPGESDEHLSKQRKLPSVSPPGDTATAQLHLIEGNEAHVEANEWKDIIPAEPTRSGILREPAQKYPLVKEMKQLLQDGKQLYDQYRTLIVSLLQGLADVTPESDWGTALAGAWALAHVAVIRDIVSQEDFHGTMDLFKEKQMIWEAFALTPQHTIRDAFAGADPTLRSITLDIIIKYVREQDTEEMDDVSGLFLSVITDERLLWNRVTRPSEELKTELIRLMTSPLVKQAFQRFRERFEQPLIDVSDAEYTAFLSEQVGKIAIVDLYKFFYVYGLSLSNRTIALTEVAGRRNSELEAGLTAVNFIRTFPLAFLRRKAVNLGECYEAVPPAQQATFIEEITSFFPSEKYQLCEGELEYLLFGTEISHMNLSAAKFLLSCGQVEDMTLEEFAKRFKEENKKVEDTKTNPVGRMGCDQTRRCIYSQWTAKALTFTYKK